MRSRKKLDGPFDREKEGAPFLPEKERSPFHKSGINFSHDESDIFSDAKMKVTRQPGSDPTMHVPAKKSAKKSGSDYDDDEPVIDPALRYSFQRNMQFLGRVFTVDAAVKPFPPAIAYNLSRNINFILRIFTQFWDEEGIAN